jgi:hypothetical protein
VTATSLWQFQDLILESRDDDVRGFDAERLLPWLEQRPEIVAELHAIGHPDSHSRTPDPDDGRLEGLYALSRLIDILLAPHQTTNADPALLSWTTPGQPWWRGPMAAVDTWTLFSCAVGAVPIAEDAFHPFFHEIVSVVLADDPHQAPELFAEHWPGAMLGGLVLARSGVTVRAGRERLNPQVAAESCIYWSWWRRNRIARDLSHGWGHNSQWRTDFRRDYLVGNELHYNVDHRTPPGHNPADEDADLTTADRRTLLRYRHSIGRDLGQHRWPYYDSLVEPRTPLTVEV